MVEKLPVAFGHFEKDWRLNRRVKLIYPVRGVGVQGKLARYGVVAK